MYVRYANLLLNMSSLHVKWDNNELKFYESLMNKPMYVARYKDDKTASFAYGRIIHGVLLKWGGVDITENVINELMIKLKSQTTEQ